jgi:hypothetical protein
MSLAVGRWAGDFIDIEPGVPHEAPNLDDTALREQRSECLIHPREWPASHAPAALNPEGTHVFTTTARGIGSAPLGLAAILLGMGRAGRQDPGVTPNHAFFQEQLSLWYPGGTPTIRINSTTSDTRTVTMESGFSLGTPQAWAIIPCCRTSRIMRASFGSFVSHHA